MNYSEQIRNYINLEIEILGKLNQEEINKAMNVIERARTEGKTVYVCGNGGSASTASHLTSDFNKGVSEKLQVAHRFECLCDNVASMMAIANDISYDDIFEYPLKRRMRKGDVLIAISGSGNSENVIRAVKYAKKLGNTIIGMSGYSGGKLKELSDVKLHVPVDNMQITEDIHLIFNHLMMFILSGKGDA